jgi:transcriptional regulator with XRE-family HTH domain
MADRIVNRRKLRDLRESTPLTQKDLAIKAGVAIRTVINAESESHVSQSRHEPTGIVLHKLAKALGVQVSELLLDPELTVDAA